MIKKIIAGLCLVFSSVAFSQQNNASPYSYYGIGDIKFKGTVENRSMGGIGILPDSIHINLQNPASYGALKFTTFTIGGSTTGTNFKTSDAEDKASRTTLDYLAVGLPINKLGIAIGLLPYSSVGYKIENTVMGSDGYERLRRFEGNGGLNRVFAGMSYNITPKFSVGADFRYNFGTIETKSLSGIPDAEIQYLTREMNDSEYTGMSFNFGAMYSTRIGQKYDWYTSVAFSPQSTLRSRTKREFATVSLTSSNAEIVVDVISKTLSDEDLKLPASVTFGSGIGEARKWFAGAEYTFTQSNELGNRFDNVTDAGFEDSHRVSVGGYYIPRYMSFSDYFSRITYRAGLKYEKTGLMINNESINDYGFSLGLGLPLGGVGGSNLNIGFEMGKRGTTKANLVEENYMSLFVSLSLNERWFIKRKYD